MIKKLLFLLVTVTSTSFTMKAQNLISNSSFETGTANIYTAAETDVFTSWYPANGFAQMTAETTNVNTGSRALKASIIAAGNPWSVQLWSNLAPTVIGKNYKISMYVKSVGGTGTIRYSTVGTGALYAPDFTPTTAWTKYEYTFTAYATTTQISLDLGKSAETYYIDDVTMVDMTPAVTQEFLLNGGFETLGSDLFANWGKWSAPANMSQETAVANVHSGTSALKAISSGAYIYSEQLVSDPMPLVVGTVYTATMWAKSTNGTGSIRFSTNPSALYGTTTAIGTSWQQVTWSFTANVTDVRLVLDLGGSTDTFYIDDVSITGPKLSTPTFDIASKVVLYPNPVTDHLNISSETAIKSVSIIDLNGKIIKTINSADSIESVNLSNLSQGMYIISTDTNQQFKFLKN